ncbi:hypothetical protein TruAng_001362 [Truncatella angustata]|nr:hypothetical protein TruAng_001362 [Truncatella angustata]
MAGTQYEEVHSGSGSESELDVDRHGPADWEESSEDEANGFLDIEAQESGDDNDDDDEDESRLDHIEELFPQFCRLPIELRSRIWDFFDPDMRAPARIFECHITDNGKCLELWAGPTLAAQSAPARAVLGTHRESRALALKFYPDIADLGRGVAQIPCHKSRDMFILPSTSWTHGLRRMNELRPFLRGFKRVAFREDEEEYIPGDDAVVRLLWTSPSTTFPDLETIYFVTGHSDYRHTHLQWCVLGSSQQFYRKTQEEGLGGCRDIETMYCWPKATGNVLAADVNPTEGDPESEFTETGPCTAQAGNGIKAFQMVEFMFTSGVQRFEKLKTAALAGTFEDYQSSGSEDSDLESENEYESEGIDDDSIDEDGGEDESEDDLVVQHTSPLVSSFGGFSPLQGEMEEDESGDRPRGADFSNLKSDSPDINQEEASDSDNVPAQKRRQRRRVMADSEDEEIESGPSELVSLEKQQAYALTSESEDDDVATPPGRQIRSKVKRSRAVLSDSEEDEDTERVDSGSSTAIKARHIQEESESSESGADESEESSEESSDESSEEDEQPRQLSLAERIGAFRAAVPIGEGDSASEKDYDEFNDEGGEGEADYERNTYGRSGYDVFQDDEEDDEISDHDDVILEMAEDGSDDGGEDES